MLVALVGLLISFFAYRLAFPLPHQRRFEIWLGLLAVHLAATFVFWLFTFEGGMDAFLYYRDPYGFVNYSPFKGGTEFIVHLDQFIKNTFGGSFLDHFLFFQCMGMIGIAFLMRTFNEVADGLGMAVPFHLYLLLFLPGLHFWTVAIGKDAPMMMAIGVALWSSLRLDRRFVWMALAIMLMALIRPHVGAITAVGAAFAILFTRQISFRIKLILVPVGLAGLLIMAYLALDRFRLDLSLESLAAFFERQQELGEDHGSGAEIQNMSFPMKVVTLLFRPFFFDAPNLMGYAASVENLMLLGIIGYIMFNWKIVLRLATRVAPVAYCIVTAVTLILLLSMVNYNIGLGQRQKMMAVPAILFLYASINMYKRLLHSHAAAAVPPPQQQPALTAARA